MNLKINIKALALSIVLAGFFTSCSQANASKANNTNQESSQAQYPEISEEAKNFYVVNDLGRNGYYSQKPIAELLGEMAQEIDIEYIAALGDTHHFDGIASVNDPLWMTNFELVYSHPELMIEWYPICGNHEYRGNTQAVIDYSNISRRWKMPSRYYSKSVEGGENEDALLVFIDTAPLISKYRDDKETYPDAEKQDKEEQLKWIEKTLKESNAKWKIVMGHHPVYAHTTKSESERTDLQKSLLPIMEKYNVDAYLCGHIHSAQHIKPTNSNIEFFVNTSGSLARKVAPIEGTQFCSSEPGFMIVSMEDNKLSFFMINEKGENIYKYSKNK